MTLKNTLIWRLDLALVCLLQAIGFTIISGECTVTQYADVAIDHTNGPSGTNYYVFSFTRTNRYGDFDSEVRLSNTEFTRLLQCFMVQSAFPNICELIIPQTIIPTSNSLFLYSASVVNNFSTGAGVSPNNGEHKGRYYVCVLPDQFFNPQGSSVLCTEETLPSNCFNDTNKCITLSRIDTALNSYVRVIFKSKGEISVQYNSRIVVVDSCNPSSTTSGTNSPSVGIITRTTASPGRETTGTTIHPAPEATANSSASEKGTDNIGLIIGAVCGSLLLIALIVIGILCWKRPVVIWKRGRKLSTDPTHTGVSTSNVSQPSQPSADNLIYHDEEIYPISEAKHHTMSSISTSDYASLDSENLDTLEAPMRKKGSIKDVYASVHQSRKRAKKPKNSNNQTAQNSENSDNPKGKRHSIKDVYALIHKSRKRAKEKQQTETNNNKADQTPQIIHGFPSSDDETYANNDVQNGDKKKPNKYSGLHEVNVNIINPYDDLLEPNDYQDAASAEAIDLQDLSNEDKTEIQPTKETDTKLQTKPVIPSKPKFLAKPGN